MDPDPWTSRCTSFDAASSRAESSASVGGVDVVTRTVKQVDPHAREEPQVVCGGHCSELALEFRKRVQDHGRQRRLVVAIDEAKERQRIARKMRGRAPPGFTIHVERLPESVAKLEQLSCRHKSIGVRVEEHEKTIIVRVHVLAPVRCLDFVGHEKARDPCEVVMASHGDHGGNHTMHNRAARREER